VSEGASGCLGTARFVLVRLLLNGVLFIFRGLVFLEFARTSKKY